MKICRNCSTQFEKACPKCAALARARWRARNVEHIRRYSKEWASQNTDKVSEHRERWRNKNREKITELNKSSTELISDGYIASLLGLPVEIVPKSLIEAKREHLKIGRILRDQNDHDH